MSTKPLVSIIIPCKKIDEYTKESIAGCKLLEYENFEIIVLPDFQSDIIKGVKIIPTGAVSPGVKRNFGIKNSAGEFCAFIDNDAYPKSDWILNALKYLEDPQVGGVGGPGLTPESDGFMQKAGGYVLSSFMVGQLSNRYKVQYNFESDDVHSCNFIAKKSVIEAAGGWNEKYWPGEDTLMCLAIKKTGKKLIESSDVVVYHHRRSLFGPHAKQVSRFGEHRGFFVKKFPENSIKITYFFPSILLISLLVGGLISIVFPLFLSVLLVGLLAYLAAGLIATISLQLNDIKLIFVVWVGIIVTHLVYGSYFLTGLAKRDLKR
ncbi:MAG: glycosyltransferase [Nitrososphaerota archaeon]|nr:glycosyltransferase [Nitrososphaerota archaeon]